MPGSASSRSPVGSVERARAGCRRCASRARSAPCRRRRTRPARTFSSVSVSAASLVGALQALRRRPAAWRRPTAARTSRAGRRAPRRRRRPSTVLRSAGHVAGADGDARDQRDDAGRGERGEAARVGDRVSTAGAAALLVNGPDSTAPPVRSDDVTGIDWLIVGVVLLLAPLRLGAGLRRRGARAGRVRDRRLGRHAGRPAAARRRPPLALVARLRPGRGADRGDGLRARLRGGGRTIARPGATVADGDRRSTASLGAVLDRLRRARDHVGARRAGARQRRRGAARGPALDDPAAPQRGAAAVERADRGARAAGPVPAHRRARGARAGADGGDRARRGRRGGRGLGGQDPRQRLRAGRRGLGLGRGRRAGGDQRARGRGAEGHARAAARAPAGARRARGRLRLAQRPRDPARPWSGGGRADARRTTRSRAPRRRSSASPATGPTTCARGASAARAR